MAKMNNIHYLLHRHPEKVIVLRECECDHPKKQKHHPDYSKPFEVELLCPKCHGKCKQSKMVEFDVMLLKLSSIFCGGDGPLSMRLNRSKRALSEYRTSGKIPPGVLENLRQIFRTEWNRIKESEGW